MNLLVIKPIKHNGRRYKPGQDILGVEEVHAKRLIMLGAATELGGDVRVITTSTEKVNENEDDTPLTQQNELIPGGLNEDDLGDPEEHLSDDEVFKLIWDNFKLEVLIEDATELGLEFAGNISKTKLINLIILNEKEDYFLDQIAE